MYIPGKYVSLSLYLEEEIQSFCLFYQVEEEQDQEIQFYLLQE